MKKIAIVVVCIVAVCFFAGCGNAEVKEYHQKLYEYYEESLLDVDMVAKSMVDFKKKCEAAEEQGITFRELFTEEEWETMEETRTDAMQTTLEAFAVLKNPPRQCEDGFEIAERIRGAKSRFLLVQELAGEDTGDESISMTGYSNVAAECQHEFLLALQDMKLYFKEIGYWKY